MKQLTVDSMASISGGDFLHAFCGTILVISLIAPNPISGGADIACGIAHLLL